MEIHLQNKDKSPNITLELGKEGSNQDWHLMLLSFRCNKNTEIEFQKDVRSICYDNSPNDNGTEPVIKLPLRCRVLIFLIG